jgi:hypothetical protein
VGKNEIKITSDNFVLDTIYKVVVKDNDAIPYFYFYYYKQLKKQLYEKTTTKI